MNVASTAADASPRVRVAGFWRRAVAGVIDLMVLSVVCIVLHMFASLVLGQPVPRLSELGPDYLVAAAINGGALAELGIALLGIVTFLYFFIFTAMGGRTPGKRVVGLRVIDAYNNPPSAPRALVRTLGYVPSVLLLALGMLWIAFDREKRGLHDWLADTYVIVE